MGWGGGWVEWQREVFLRLLCRTESLFYQKLEAGSTRSNVQPHCHHHHHHCSVWFFCEASGWISMDWKVKTLAFEKRKKKTKSAHCELHFVPFLFYLLTPINSSICLLIYSPHVCFRPGHFWWLVCELKFYQALLFSSLVLSRNICHSHLLLANLSLFLCSLII